MEVGDTLFDSFADTDSMAVEDVETIGEALNEACVAVVESVECVDALVLGLEVKVEL